MDLSRQQVIAIRRPCFEPEDTTFAGFGWRAVDPTVTIRLTMNIGMQ